MLLPALNQAREAAKKVSCASNLRQVGLATRMYANDNKGWLPPRYGYTYGYPSGPNAFRPAVSMGAYEGSDALSLLFTPEAYGQGNQAYLPSADVLFCPSDDVYRPYRTNDGRGLADPPGSPYPGLISYYYLFCPADGFPQPAIYHWSDVPCYRYGQKSPQGASSAQTAMLCDQGLIFPNPGDPLSNVWYHKNGWNVLYMDGHVKFVPRDPVARKLNYNGDWVAIIKEFDAYY
jgi:prepilin-type processing-associated H-X9-DG protein